MPKVDMYNVDGKKVGDIDLKDDVFGVEPNKEVVHEAVVNFLANQRQGTQSTKTRAEVRGGGRKPWKQKGTGRARQGSIRAPHWMKGGIALGPKPRSYKYTINKKVRRLALKSVFSSKVLEQQLIVLDTFNFAEIKTKNMIKVLENLKVNEKVLIVIPENDLNVQKSAKNIPGTKVCLVNTVNVYDLVKYSKLIITKQAVEKIEEVYA